MARSTTVVSQSHVALRNTFYWPEQQITFWIIFMIVAGIYLIEIFAKMSTQQGRLNLGVPWIIPFGITVGALTEFLVWCMLILLFQRKLQPGMVILFSFAMFVLFLTGMIGTAIQLFGPVVGGCQKYVWNNSTSGLTLDTLAWLMQEDLCTDWYVAFAFWVVGTIFLVWMMVLARRVVGRSYDD